MARFRLDVRETRARGRIRDANQVFAGGALNLPARVAGVALQRLVAVGTIEFEFLCVHKLDLYMRKPDAKSREKNCLLFLRSLRL